MAKRKSTSKKSGKKRSTSSRVARILRVIFIWFFSISLIWVLSTRFINPPLTWLMVQRGLERKADGKDWKLEKEWKSFDELSNNLKIAAMAGEDSRFLVHGGLDLNAIEQAYEKNQKSDR